MIKHYVLCCIIAVIPFSISAQNSTLESCGLKLSETHQRIYSSDSFRKTGLNSISNQGLSELRNAFTEWTNCIRGNPIPNLNFSTINGKKYSNSDLRGKVLVINFWFKSCAPCVAEMPSLNKLRKEFKDKNVLFIGFARDTEQALKPAYLNSGKFLFEIVPSSKDIAQKFYFYGAGYPTTYIVDQNGRIVKTWTGYSVFSEDPYEMAKPIINRLLSHRVN